MDILFKVTNYHLIISEIITMNEAIWFLREIKNELIFCGHNTFSPSHRRRPMMEDSYSGKYYSSDAQKNGNKVGDKVPANVNQGEDIPERETWNNKVTLVYVHNVE